jgi:hypothetical protein
MEKNPYEILDVSPTASKVEITKAVAMAMKCKQYPVDVIAKAQKSLMKSEERIIADYLRPILPIIKQFNKSDFCALDKPVPTLKFLSEFDNLDKAIAQANQEELLEQATLCTAQSELLTQGITACKEEYYPQAIKYLEEYNQNSIERHSKDWIQAQIWLIRAYQMDEQLKKAIALCQLMTKHNNSQVQAWANKTLPLLSKEISHV